MDQGIGQRDRYARQAALVPGDRIAETAVTIIGVGAVGRQLALQLAAMGVRTLQLIDFDKVDWPNVAAQGYATSDVGWAKVQAVASAIRDYDSSIHVEGLEDRWRPFYQTHPVVFCCVDSIAAWAAIWKGIGSRCPFWADARMLGEVIRILSATDEPSAAHYTTTIFEPGQAELGRCTARSTIYAASIAAGLLCQRFTGWLRGDECEWDTLLNLRATEWNVLASGRSMEEIVKH